MQQCEPTENATVAALKLLLEGGANGVLLPAQFAHAAAGSPLLARLGVPVVVLAPGAALPSMCSIGIDQFEAARKMTLLLIALGHRRIAFIHGLPRHAASETRYRGYKAALEAAGLPLDHTLSARGDFTFQSGLHATATLLDREPLPTAIFAANDLMAAAAASVAHRRALRIPEDLSVAGFDDAPIASQIWPTLTTVRQPLKLIAEKAVEKIIGALRRQETGLHCGETLVPFEIVERESTGPARDS